MNTVKIEYAYFQPAARIEINGEPLDILNDALSALRKDFCLYAPSVFRMLDQYFSAPYVLEFTGTAYQGRCLETLSNESAYCQRVQFREMSLPVSESLLLEGFGELQKKYGVEEPADLAVKIRTAMEPDTNGGDVCICLPDAIPSAFSEKLLLCLSDQYAVYNAGGKYVFEIPEEMKDLFLEHYRLSAKVNPYLCDMVRKLPMQKFSREDAASMKALRTGVPQYILESVPESMDADQTAQVRLLVYPRTASDAFRLAVSEPEVISLDGCVLTAKTAGTCELLVTDQTGDVLEKRSITVISHAYTQSIRLIPAFTYLMPTKTGKIDAYLLPENAEDAKTLTWSSSDTDVAQVSSEGKIIAFQTGTCTITAATDHCSASVTLQVKAPVSSVTVSPSQITVEESGSCNIDCTITPANSAVDKIEWSLDKQNLGKIRVSPDNRSCRFIAEPGKAGSCKVTCDVNDGAHTAATTVRILPPPDHTGLYVATIIFTVLSSVVLSWLTMITGIAGYLACFSIPTILSLVGLQHESPRYHFKRLLVINLVCGILYLVIHFAACGSYYG